MRKIGSLAGLLVLLGGCASAAQPEQSGDTSSALQQQYTAAQFLALHKAPIVVGHEGAGENFAQWPSSVGVDPSKPINDTVDSVRLGFQQGAPAVEVDAEMTKDGQIVAYHDFDFLPDYTCINSYTLGQLKQKVPYIATLDETLRVARQFNSNSPTMSGILIVELKTPSPLCDPGDVSEAPFTQAVVNRIYAMDMQDAVIFDGFSPNLLAMAKQLAPSIPVELDLSILQLMTPAQVTAAGYAVTIVQKQFNPFGLQWAEVGPIGGPAIYRLPGYTGVPQFLGTAKFGLHAASVSAEMDFIGTVGTANVKAFVGGAHQLGMQAWAAPAKNAAQFGWLASLGFDAAYCDDIPSALPLQPPL